MTTTQEDMREALSGLFPPATISWFTTFQTKTEVAEFLTKLDRKVEDKDVDSHPELIEFAEQYALGYTGSFEFMLEQRDACRRYGHLSLRQARGTMNCLRAELLRSGRYTDLQGSEQTAPSAASGQDIEPGVYVTADAIVKVQENRAGTNVYALVWESFSGTRLTLDGEVVQAHWVYQQGLIRNLVPEQRMTVEEAKKFATQWRQCARCGAKLEAAESVERGVGPICMKSFRI
jgi:hypothetical protein